MKSTHKFRSFISCFFPVLFVLILSAQGQNKIVVGNIDPGYVDSKGFTLNQQTTVKINGVVGGFEKWGDRIYYYGWILDSRSRNVVWHLLDNRSIRDRLDKGEMFTFSDEVELPAGSYEVYYTGGHSTYSNRIKDLGDFFKKIFGNDSQEYRRKYRDNLSITLSVDSSMSIVVDDGKTVVDEMSRNSVASIIRAGNDKKLQAEFALSKETVLDIYAIGEGRDSRVFDYAWIYDASTYQRVWQMSFQRSDYAGGADKNMMFDDSITLPEGNYIVYYVTDDSHSFDGWNLMPPDDPQFWGITIWAHSAEDAENIIPFNEDNINQPFIQITQVRSDAHISKGFEISKDMEVRILAFGEGYSKNDLSDYGWIINAETSEKVWDMRDTGIEYAGGAKKNRMVDEKITLPEGKYIVYYTTDGSHAYNEWNDAPPFDPEKYGITIWTAEESDKDFVKEYNPNSYDNENILVQITRVGNDVEKSKSFVLEEVTKVRIIAIGEGSDGDMGDFGWIENSNTGDIIWEMTYRKTEWAGGDEKNRKFDGMIMLDAGSYRVFYQSDGSHSYSDWNADPPLEPEMYGITVLRGE